MRNRFSYLVPVLVLLVGVGFLAPFHTASAQGVLSTILDITGWGINVFYGFLGKILWWVIIPITSQIMNLIGLLVDAALALSLTPEFYKNPAITEGWVIIRDLCNIFFIFILVYIGIRTILGLDTGETRRVVVSVVIAALLINFSLFLTRAAIDVSNIFTIWITEGIKGLSGSGGISDATVAVLDMPKLAEQQKTFSDASFEDFGLTVFATGIALTIVNLIAIYVFFKVAFLMFGRVVSFLLLLIMSPIGFVGHLVPKLKDYASQWKDELTKACLMAPMFLLLLYITLFMATKFEGVLEKVGDGIIKNPSNDLLGTNFGISEYLLFVIVGMLLLKSLEVAGEYTGKVAGQIGGVLKSAAMLATGTVAVGSLGRVANVLKDQEWLKKGAAQGFTNNSLLRTATRVGSGMLLSSADTVSKSNLGLKSGISGLSKVGLDINKLPGAEKSFRGAEKGFEGDVKAHLEKEESFGKLLGDDMQGAINRSEYAFNTKNNLINKTAGLVGVKTASVRSAEKIAKKAGEEYTKAETGDLDNLAKGSKNRIVSQAIRDRKFNDALHKNDESTQKRLLLEEIVHMNDDYSSLKKYVKKTEDLQPERQKWLDGLNDDIREANNVGDIRRVNELKKLQLRLQNNMTRVGTFSQRLSTLKSYHDQFAQRVKSGNISTYSSETQNRIAQMRAETKELFEDVRLLKDDTAVINNRNKGVYTNNQQSGGGGGQQGSGGGGQQGSGGGGQPGPTP